MRVRIRFFAIQRAQLGRREHDLDIPDGATIGAAWEALVLEFPGLEEATSSVRFARNGTYADTREVLSDGDELAIIPPVAGGSDQRGGPGQRGGSGQRGGVDPSAGSRADLPGGSDQPGGLHEPGTGHDPGPPAPEARYRRIEIVASSLDDGLVGELCATVPTPRDGAVAMFVGRTRESPGTPAPGQEEIATRFAGQRVTGLSYEAFESMALAVLEQIADEIDSRFGVRRLAIVHRVGDVAVGEASVVIVAASPHREEAFSACRHAIEELKARAPIWKAEHFADGSVWLGAPARTGPGEGDDGAEHVHPRDPEEDTRPRSP